MYVIAAKAALRRKHQHEKNLEQTSAQVVQLEQQIYSIEAANINHETLQAMKSAGDAMKKIHGDMTLEQVDDTMYVMSAREMSDPELKTRVNLGKGMFADDFLAGTNSENNIYSARRLATLLRTSRWASRWTRESWTPSWRDWSRRRWTSACSTLDLRRWELGWRVYPLQEIRSVSYSHRKLLSDRSKECRANDKQSTSHTQPRKKTRMPNWPSSGPRWPCSQSPALEY
jgi:hypothetical protein